MEGGRRSCARGTRSKEKADRRRKAATGGREPLPKPNGLVEVTRTHEVGGTRGFLRELMAVPPLGLDRYGTGWTADEHQERSESRDSGPASFGARGGEDCDSPGKGREDATKLDEGFPPPPHVTLDYI